MGDCDGFDVGLSSSTEIEVEHSGVDGGHLEWARINGTTGEEGKIVSLKCQIGEKLDGSVKKTYQCSGGGMRKKFLLC